MPKDTMESRREKFERLFAVKGGRGYFVEHPDEICPLMLDFKFDKVDTAMIRSVVLNVPGTLSSVIGEDFDGDLSVTVRVMVGHTGLNEGLLYCLIEDMCVKGVVSLVENSKGIDDATVSDHESGSKQGRLELSNGDVYEGDLVNGRMIGKGRMVYANGDVYDGDFVDGKMTGKGKKIYSNGDIYEGDWVDDKRTGKGRYTWPDGDVYEGDWVDDMMTGKGKYIWSDGDVYEGDFVDDMMTGKGKYAWPNGNVYEGDFIDDKRTGKGRFTWSDGNVYEGDFIDGKRTGKGRYI